MKPNDTITLAAFINALKKLDKPLPKGIQTQLNNISKDLSNDPDNLDNLDAIAENDPLLDKLYQLELADIRSNTGSRSKGLPPEPLPTNPTAELTNAAINIFGADDSVTSAKNVVKSNLIQRIYNFIAGNETNV